MAGKKEQQKIKPTQEFKEQANTKDRVECQNYPQCFERYANLLDWKENWDKVLDATNPPFYKWFVGGKLNASYNCIDRHLEERKDQTAIIWEGEKGENQRIAYQDLYRKTNELAAVLRDELDIEEDEVITLHLPMLPALPITMLACARIGAPHSEVFAGFSAKAVAERMDDAKSNILITCDGYYRRGKFLNHKEKADKAVEEADIDVDKVLIWKRNDEIHPEVDLKEDRDLIVQDLLDNKKGERVEPVPRNSEDLLFLMYTSGTTGKPKGCQHRTGGYLAYVAGTSRDIHDIHPEDTYWCMADIGWITGHSYIVYGPLALGTTTVMYEGAPDYPNKGRTWEIAEKYDIDTLNTSPTAIRMFSKWGKEYPEQYDFDFKLLGTVGEPIQEEAWEWYYKNIGKRKAPVVDKWWQTETGGNLITTYPASDEMKPGAAGKPIMGIEAAVYDEEGKEIDPGEQGSIVITKPWPGMLQTIYGNDERFISEYWENYSDTESDEMEDWVYEPEDEVRLEEDGYYRFLGRKDEVMNVAGHRLGTGELEDAITEVPEVAEVAVAARKHAEKGEVPDAYVILKQDTDGSDELREKITKSVETEIGPIARPYNIFFVEDVPKTRSGKIMRRLLEDISNQEPLGDITTLKDPEVPEQIREKVRSIE
ncbi:MAG: Acyl-coenzyme A synthetase/AMP-(fatty) acid ligase Asc [Candidatus Methanohalarchaeum thermophilum]|uniref:Acetate--CoA ligase n=1 Tax=Methanohalarchaeum thermophilum TaxID=1903181 RepID=A0A1Q6DVZ9_METT1|nr:MAG: Acyl-coenzyme A synthetase/AMP-(fatty) acid ligase Asc [Candidatus Methanohalarchaeum thermophilum]